MIDDSQLTPEQRGNRRRFYMLMKLDDDADHLAFDDSPEINLSKLDQSQWYVLVLWLHGMSIVKIADILRMHDGAVGHPIRERKHGGYLPKARKDMTKEERRHHLKRLKENRMDDGKLPDKFFTV
jgi:hypothetical protein